MFKPVILVTGCGSGVGFAIARILYGIDYYRVVVTAREKSLGHLRTHFKESDRFKIKILDITSHEDRENLIKDIEKEWGGGVDILINNAGISYRSALEHMDDDSEFHQMNTNYFGPMALIRLVLPSMRKRGRGKIINISSVSGMLAMPTMASYSASKHALEGASEALWYEVKPLGINVSLVQPGFINSNSFRHIYYSPLAKSCDNTREGPYCDYYFYMTPFVERMMNRSLSTPERIAKKVLKIIRRENPPLWVPATFDAIVFYYLRRLIPRSIFHQVLFWLLPHGRDWGKPYSHARIRK